MKRLISLLVMIGFLFLGASCGLFGKNPPVDPGPDPVPKARDYGIYTLHGFGKWEPSLPLWDLPWLDGLKIMVYWSQIETSPGIYNFSGIDYHLQLAASKNKKVVLSIVTADERRGDYLPDSATPSWLYKAGVIGVEHQYPGAEVPDKPSFIPVYWQAIYLSAYGTFIRSLADHYDGNPTLARIEIGVGIYGETIISNALIQGVPGEVDKWKKFGLTKENGPALWIGAVNNIIDLYTANWKKTKLALLISDSALGAIDPEIDKKGLAEGYASHAANQGVALQFCGTLPTFPYGSWPADVLDNYRTQVPVVYEANGPSGGFGAYCAPEKTDLAQLQGTIATMKERGARSTSFWCNDMIRASQDPQFYQVFADLSDWLKANPGRMQ